MSDLSLVVAGLQLSGWEDIRVTRSIERFPSDFEISMTERFPGELKPFVVVPGDSCQVKLGDDLVLTGYVDGYKVQQAPGSGTMIRIVGRSKCSDLVDASAEWPGAQIAGSTALEIAKKLAFNFGIAVDGGAEDDTLIPLYNLIYGETSYDIIERVCRFRALLAYDMPDGSLRLSRAASIKSSSGLREGVNIQAFSIDYRIDGRFSEYIVVTQSVDTFSDVGSTGYLNASIKDLGVTRWRRKYIVSEAEGSDLKMAYRRADWEYRRRAGRSAQLHVVTDSWRDSNGLLWEPNTLVTLDIPSAKLFNKAWLIADVTYKMDGQSGTTCELLIMPPEAFAIQPASQPDFLDIRKAMQGTPLGDDAQPPLPSQPVEGQ